MGHCPQEANTGNTKDMDSDIQIRLVVPFPTLNLKDVDVEQHATMICSSAQRIHVMDFQARYNINSQF